MTPAFRRTAGRLAVAALATTALTGAAVAGGQAAHATTTCDTSPIVKTFTTLLTLRDNTTPTTPPCR